MQRTMALVGELRNAGEDFEWYPTTRRMVEKVSYDMRAHCDRCASILDIGAGDGRVLKWLAEAVDAPKLFSIEKATILQQQQPDEIIPVGAEFFEQDLMSLSVDVLFSNPPYSEFEEWAERIIRTAHTTVIYLVLPQRWQESEPIKGALQSRGAATKVILEDNFLDADRRARAVVHIIRVTFVDDDESRWSYRHHRRQDPFDVWFDANIDTFDREKELNDEDLHSRVLARIRGLDSIPEMVAAYDEERARMEDNYRAIFRLDMALLKELGVDKNSVREGLKKRMAGLKDTYWRVLFERLDVITSRLTTKTKRAFLDRLTGQTSIAFTATNAYAVVLWAIKAANQYFDGQVVDVFRRLSTHDGVSRYVSNQQTWERDRWRYNLDPEKHAHYALDYRVVLHHYAAIFNREFGAYDYPGNLHTSCHETIDDLIAVFGNLGFPSKGAQSRVRVWHSNVWQDFTQPDGRVLFQVKAFLNGNLHFRFDQRAIKALNIEAGRLLGWLRSPADVVTELGYTADDAEAFFGSNQRLGGSAVRLLGAAVDTMSGSAERAVERFYESGRI